MNSFLFTTEGISDKVTNRMFLRHNNLQELHEYIRQSPNCHVFHIIAKDETQALEDALRQYEELYGDYLFYPNTLYI